MGSRVSRSTSRTSADKDQGLHHHPGSSAMRTSFGNFRECQTRTSLQVDILRVDQGAQRSKRLSGKEISLGTLHRPVSDGTWE